MAKVIDSFKIEVTEEKRGDIIDLKQLGQLDQNYIKNYIQIETEKSKDHQKNQLEKDLKIELEQENQKYIKKINAEIELKFEKEANEKFKEKEKKIAKLEAEIQHFEIQKKRDIEIEVAKKTINFKEEIYKLKLQKSHTQPAILGADLEGFVYKQLVNNNEINKIISTKSKGADFIYNVLPNGHEIIIECKNAETWGSNWVKKIIADAIDKDAKYKIIVTQVSKNSSQVDLSYWVEDAINNVYVVKPHFISEFIFLISMLIKKENEIVNDNTIEGKKESENKLQLLKSFQNNELRLLAKELKTISVHINAKCSTIDNASNSIKTAALKLQNKKMMNIIQKLEDI